MLQWIKNEWSYLYGTFHGSETILWARLNVALGSAWAALQVADLSPVFNNPRLLTYWIIFSNFVNEFARRNRAEYNPDGSIR
jgi:hypothetical protein